MTSIGETALSIFAATDSRLITALAVAGGLAVLGLLLVLTSLGELRGRRTAKVPAAYRPAPGDEVLERRTLERYLAWSAIAAIFMAVWLPVYWLREPTRLAEKREKFLEVQVYENSSGNQGGEALYNEFCASCHGKEGRGGFSNVFIDDKEVKYAEPPLRFIYERYKAAGRSEEEVTQLIYDAIDRGRPGTPMPTWSIAFGGPFISHQIDTIVEYLQEIQVEITPGHKNSQFKIPDDDPTDGEAIFKANCSVCHTPGGPSQEDDELIGSGLIGPNLRVTFERLSRDEVYDVIAKGRINMNRPSMPAWAALGERAIRSLVEFIESIQRSA